MADITPLRSDQIAEAKYVIYSTAHALFRDRDNLEEAAAYYAQSWPLHDIDDFQNRYMANGGTFLVISEGGRIVGTGALRRLEDKIGEIKRLWLLPEYQGQGLGYRMLLQLMGLAREKGYTRLRLETSPAYQQRAFKFYQQLGFYEIPHYGDDEADVGMELVLPQAPHGVFTAALTPLKPDGSLDLDNVLPYLDFLARRGCHGALLFGTTGEGPSFSPRQRLTLAKVALEITQTHPGFTLLMGTGTPSLDETIELTRAAYDLGLDGVVVLPPYFNRKVSDEGLFAWFSALLRSAVPQGRTFLGYHIPQMTGVPFSLPLLERLKTTFPERFTGIKNSWTEAEFAQAVGEAFGASLVVLAGFDNLFHLTLTRHGAGCITASASLVSPLLRQLWDTFQAGQDPAPIQAELNRIRAVMDAYPPAPALLKGLLARWHGFPCWNVCPPLVPASQEVLDKAESALGGPF